MAESALQLKYRAALDHLVEQMHEDRYVLAVMVGGSLSYDEVWERSDIDLLVITTEDLKAGRTVTLNVDGINVHAMCWSRSKFKTMMQGAVRSSFMHSMFSKSTLLFSKDDSLLELYEDITHVGARDREIQTLNFVVGVLAWFTKAEKWYRVKQDWNYSFFYLMKSMDSLAAVEVLSHGQIPIREVVAQALKVNPGFFGRVYTGLIEGPKTEATIGAAIEDIRAYLRERKHIFNPIFEFLSEAGGSRSSTEIQHYFKTNWALEGADFICEWLADEELIHKVSSPVRLVEKSKVTLEEAAYFYED